MEKDIESEGILIFNFGLESPDGNKIGIEKGSELLEMITLWAEKNNCQIGGGFYRPKKKLGNDHLFNI